MTFRRILVIAWVVQLVCGLAPMPACADDPDPVATLPWAQAYDRATAAFRKGDYKAAQREALQLTLTAQFRAGDLEYVGAVRGIVDELRAKKQEALANEVLGEVKKSGARGEAANAVRGRPVSARAARSLPMVFRKHLKSRGFFNPEVDLRRIRAGTQATVLKIYDSSNRRVAFFKGIDAVLWAPIYDEHRAAIYQALGISPNTLDQTASTLMDRYDSYDRKKECIALLSVIGSDRATLSDHSRRRLLRFLRGKMKGERDVELRREAMLALALQDALDRETVNSVVDFYETSHNVWECFPVVQFFQYHKGRIQKMGLSRSLRERFSTPDMEEGLYTPYIKEVL